MTLLNSALYKSEFPTERNKMEEFLQGLSSPVIDLDPARKTDSSLCLVEVIKTMQSNKVYRNIGTTVVYV